MSEASMEGEGELAGHPGSEESFRRLNHDLRTPAGVILGFSELLLEDDLSEEHKDDVRRIHEAARQMLDLLDRYREEGWTARRVDDR